MTSARQNFFGNYELTGELTNVGNLTLQFVQVTAHLYDSSGNLVGDATGYTSPSNLDPGHTGTINIFTSQNTIAGTPSGFRLSYDWS
jgi:hypothetical protein